MIYFVKNMKNHLNKNIMKIKAKSIKVISVLDFDSGFPIDLQVLKLETGGMIAIDASFIEQDIGPVYSPFDEGIELDIED